MPDLNSVHINRALADLSIAFQNDMDSYAVGLACAQRRVESRSDYYFLYGREYGSAKDRAGVNARALSNLRLPGTEAPEVDYALSTGNYNCSSYALRDLVTDEEIDRADAPLRPLIDAATALAHRLRNDMEFVFAQIAADAGNYNASNKRTLTSGTTSWAAYTSSTSDPLKDIRDAKTVLEKTLQREPNTLLLSADTARVLADHPAIKDIVKYTDPNWLTSNGLPKRLRNLNVIVASAVAGGQAEGAAYSGNYLFMDRANGRATAIICYVPPDRVIGTRDIASFICFQKRDSTTGAYGISLRSYRDDKRKGWLVEAEVCFDLRFPVVDGSGLNTGAYMIVDATV